MCLFVCLLGFFPRRGKAGKREGDWNVREQLANYLSGKFCFFHQLQEIEPVRAAVGNWKKWCQATRVRTDLWASSHLVAAYCSGSPALFRPNVECLGESSRCGELWFCCWFSFSLHGSAVGTIQLHAQEQDPSVMLLGHEHFSVLHRCLRNFGKYSPWATQVLILNIASL